MPYKLYAGTPTLASDVSFVVVVAYRNPGGYLKGEWFFIGADDSHSFDGQKVRFSEPSFPSGEVELDEEFMYQELLDQATARFRRWVRSAGPDALGYETPKLLEVGKPATFLAHIWLRGICQPQFRKLFHGSDSEELRDVIGWVSKLAVYEARNL